MNAIIDGHNLLHAIGLANRNTDAKGLARGRAKLLDWLADRRGEHQLLVVFDGGRRGSPVAAEHRGVHVQYSLQRTADERIEELIHADKHPAKLTIVSNDRQVRDAGRQRGCIVLACSEFVDVLVADPKRTAPPPDEKPAPPIDSDELLAAFSQPKPRPRK